MSPIPRINIENYASMRDRPLELYEETFYRPVEIPTSPELEQLADQAVGALLADGYKEDEATEHVAVHIHAAAYMGSLTTSQQELTGKIVDSPYGNDGASYLMPSTAMSLAPFLPHVTPYEFNLESWLTDVMRIDDWDRTRPALRWLELWEGQVTKSARAYILNRLVETDEGMGSKEIAVYAGKLKTALEDEPELLQSLLATIRPDNRLPLFGEFEADATGDILPVTTDDGKICIDGVRRARHVNYFAGGCTSMDAWHKASLFNEGCYANNDDYGRVVFAYVGGQPVGSITMRGEHSMLALRTVQNSDKTLPLVMGGVYVPRREVVDRAQAVFDEHGKWAKLELDELLVRPLRFLEIDGFESPDELARLRASLEKIKQIREQLDSEQ